MKERLIVSISHEIFELACEIANKYKNIELRLNELSFSNEQILTLIDTAELVVLTGLEQIINDNNLISELQTNKKQRSKLIIDCPHNSVELFNGFPLTLDSIVTKMLSYHNWDSINSSIVKLFDDLLSNYKDFIYNNNALVKFAVNIESDMQLEELFSILTYKHLTNRLIIIPLGEKYKKERIQALRLGSRYMFCYITNPVVPSQLSYFEF